MGLAVVAEASALIAGVMPVALSDADVLSGVGEMQSLVQMVQAQVMGLVREAEARGLLRVRRIRVPWLAARWKVSRPCGASRTQNSLAR